VYKDTAEPKENPIYRSQVINPSPKKVTICASEAKPKQRGEAPVCTRNTIAKGKGDEED
jgi:hypothetical protein